jgi:hypothetical protein
MDKITAHYRASQQRESSNASNTSTDLNLPTEVCTGTAKTKEQSQRRAFNLIPIMVSPTTDRLVRTGTQRNSSWPGETFSTQRPNTLPQTCLSIRSFSLAVLRRAIHCRYQSPAGERALAMLRQSKTTRIPINRHRSQEFRFSHSSSRNSFTVGVSHSEEQQSSESRHNPLREILQLRPTSSCGKDRKQDSSFAPRS